jgi:protein-L-isoaspartate(D-aspartate) O-methyltransferase
MTSQRARDRLIERLTAQDIRDSRVLEVIRTLPRHAFIDEALASRAYEDTALPIGHGQTISQPFVVARMTEALIADPLPKRVLEIGTGCGYQAAVLGMLVAQVYTVERIEDLLRAARRRFRQLGLTHVRSKHADGSYGWVEEGPFDGILMAAAGMQLPASLLEQLAVGGRLIAPVGTAQAQRLLCITRTDTGFSQQDLGAVLFVPLRGGLQ